MIGVSVEGLPEVERAVEAVKLALSDKSDALDEATAVLLARVRERFLRQVDPDLVPWIPSMAAMARARKGRGGGTLFDTGNLFHSIQEFASTEDSREIGTDVPYAAKHEFGLDGMVQRRFMGASPDDVEAMVAVVVNRLNQKLGD
jgi:phage gpG-like protein